MSRVIERGRQDRQPAYGRQDRQPAYGRQDRQPAYGRPWTPRGSDSDPRSKGVVQAVTAPRKRSVRGRPRTATRGRRPSDAALIIALVSVLCMIGLVMVLSSSSVDALREYGSAWVFFKHQVLWLGLGAVLMAVASRIDYHRYQKLAIPLALVVLALLAVVLVPHMGVQVSGASRWVGFGQFRLQPSELMKLAMVLFGADLLTRRAHLIADWRSTVRPVAIIFAAGAGLIMMQPDMGTTLILACIVFTLLYSAGAPPRVMGMLLGMGVAGGMLLGIAQPYRRARLLSFLDPSAHAAGAGYQVMQSLVGLGRGHLVGVGLGGSLAKWGFLPNAYTDFIFSIIGEELGLLGSLLVVGLFAALALVGIRVAARSPDRLGSLLAIGITCWVVSQAVINIGAVIGLLPVTGVPLPLVSYGGSSTVIMMCAMGILVSIARARAPVPGR